MRSRQVMNIVLVALIALALPLLAHSPEHPVGTTVVAAAPHSRGYEAMATDGTDFFVIWSDYRAETRGSLVGTRVRRSGQVLDPLGIRLTTLGNNAQDPHVVWDGGAYLITWTSGWPDRDVYAARIDRDGRIVMAPRIIVSDAMAATGRYAASNGSLTVIAYHSLDYDAPTRVVFLDREGNILHHETIPGTSEKYMRGLSVAATVSHFMLVWSTFDFDQTRTATINAMALSSAGHFEKGPIPIGTGSEPLVATDGSRFLVVWQQWVAPISSLVARTIDASLTQTTAVQTLTRAERFPPSLLWRGNRYEIFVGRYTVANGSQIYSIEVDADGKKIAERSLGPMTTGYDEAFPIAATNGGDLMVAFVKRFGPSWNGHQIFSRIYPASSLTPTPDQLLAWSGNAHNNPDVTSSAAGHFVAWQESEGVYATRIDANGLSLDGRGIRLSDGSSRPHLAFNGTNYVVAWLEEWESIRVHWVSPATGKIVASAEIPTLWTEKIAMTASAEATYLAYVDEDLRVKVIRIPHTTHVPDAVPAIVSPEDMYVDAPALSWNGSTLLVVWNENRVPSVEPDLPGAVRAHAARVTADLTLLDPAPLLIAATDADMTFTFGTPSVASNGADWLVVTDSREQEHILARRVLSNGTVEGSEPVKIADGSNPVAAFDGTRYTVSWKSGQPFWWPDASIVLAAVPASGTISATLRTLVSTHVTADAPALARTATGEIAVVYTKLSFAPEHMGVERSYVRVMDLGSRTRGRVVRR